jgi:hypothetical protein
MSGRPVDPGESRIVLVGTPAYDDPRLPDVPVVANNIADLAAVFTDPQIGGFDITHCVAPPPRASIAEVGDLLVRAASEAEDLLLFYYSGHGLLGPRSYDLYLSLAATRLGQLPFTALPFAAVREACLESGAKSRVVILDSCFSGRAIGETLSANDEILGQVEIRGTYTLTSAPANRTAVILPGEQHTAFTERLLRLLRDGSPQAGRMLSLGDIYGNLHRRMRAEGLPTPQQRGTETADLLGLVRNRFAYGMVHKDSEMGVAIGQANDNIGAIPLINVPIAVALLDGAVAAATDKFLRLGRNPQVERLMDAFVASRGAGPAVASCAQLLREYGHPAHAAYLLALAERRPHPTTPERKSLTVDVLQVACRGHVVANAYHELRESGCRTEAASLLAEFSEKASDSEVWPLYRWLRQHYVDEVTSLHRDLPVTPESDYREVAEAIEQRWLRGRKTEARRLLTEFAERKSRAEVIDLHKILDGHNVSTVTAILPVITDPAALRAGEVAVTFGELQSRLFVNESVDSNYMRVQGSPVEESPSSHE